MTGTALKRRGLGFSELAILNQRSQDSLNHIVLSFLIFKFPLDKRLSVLG